MAAAIFAIAASSHQEYLLFKEDFEGDQPFSKVHNLETGEWDYAIQYISAPVYQGSKAVRFEIRADQPLVKNGKRSEAVIIKNIPGKGMWYSFAVYFPSDGFSYDSQREVINQWYQDGSPATSLRAQQDHLFLETGPALKQREQIDIGLITKNTWHEMVFHFIHSHYADGLVEVWYDGKQVISHRGGNMYDDVLPKWKIGLYKAAFKYGTSESSKRIIFFDDIAVGNEKGSYEKMKPSKEERFSKM